jgi:hypothetical protein
MLGTTSLASGIPCTTASDETPDLALGRLWLPGTFLVRLQQQMLPDSLDPQSGKRTAVTEVQNGETGDSRCIQEQEAKKRDDDVGTRLAVLSPQQDIAIVLDAIKAINPDH